jgi:hypothetical protein
MEEEEEGGDEDEEEDNEEKQDLAQLAYHKCCSAHSHVHRCTQPDTRTHAGACTYAHTEHASPYGTHTSAIIVIMRSTRHPIYLSSCASI